MLLGNMQQEQAHVRHGLNTEKAGADSYQHHKYLSLSHRKS